MAGVLNDSLSTQRSQHESGRFDASSLFSSWHGWRRWWRRLFIGFPSETIIGEADVTATQWIHLAGIDCVERAAIGILEASNRPPTDRGGRKGDRHAGIPEDRQPVSETDGSKTGYGQLGRETHRHSNTDIGPHRCTGESETDMKAFR